MNDEALVKLREARALLNDESESGFTSRELSVAVTHIVETGRFKTETITN